MKSMMYQVQGLGNDDRYKGWFNTVSKRAARRAWRKKFNFKPTHPAIVMKVKEFTGEEVNDDK